jgi:thymidine kinase
MESSKLDMILGPMFSGKTTKLLEMIDMLNKKEVKYIVVKPTIDDRYTNNNNNFIVSHNFKKKECIVTKNLDNVIEEIKKNQNNINPIKYVLIDEAQFFNGLYNFCIYCLETININVIVTGLDGDFLRKPMGEILNLLPIANTITKLSAKCNHLNCSDPAIFSHRIVSDKNQVLIGGNDKYIPLCRIHYTYNN